ncbi:MAG: R3H domain-containing nucleic acid-binding protein [Patescibacteria group bacterium]
MTQPQINQIKETIQQALKTADFSGEVDVNIFPEGVLNVNLKSEEAGWLIGHNGENLWAWQQLIRAIISRQIGSPVQLRVDVNDYQRNRLASLKESVLSLAQEVRQQGSPRSLGPMNSYERRFVHTTLAEVEGVKTESTGEGGERRVVILPV